MPECAICGRAEWAHDERSHDYWSDAVYCRYCLRPLQITPGISGVCDVGWHELKANGGPDA